MLAGPRLCRKPSFATQADRLRRRLEDRRPPSRTSRQLEESRPVVAAIAVDALASGRTLVVELGEVGGQGRVPERPVVELGVEAAERPGTRAVFEPRTCGNARLGPRLSAARAGSRRPPPAAPAVGENDAGWASIRRTARGRMLKRFGGVPGARSAVETRPVVAEAGGEVVVEVDRVSSGTGSAKKRHGRSRTRTWSAGSSRTCPRTRTIPAGPRRRIERLCADALVDAERSASPERGPRPLRPRRGWTPALA